MQSKTGVLTSTKFLLKTMTDERIFLPKLEPSFTAELIADKMGRF